MFPAMFHLIFLLFVLREISAELWESMTMNLSHGHCYCYRDVEPECRCAGDDMVAVPVDLDKDIARLVIAESGLRILGANSLQPYKKTLTELTLMNNPYLNFLEPGIFNSLPELQTIYIHGLPSLFEINPGVFNVYLPKLKIIRIVHSGLKIIPHFNDLHADFVLHMIDLENNNIRKIDHGQVSVRTEELLLNYNHISSVQNRAFEGSQMAKLSLKGNRDLVTLHEQAFVGISSLRQLDLSMTSITALPTEGLQEIDILKIEDVETLKVFPSIYNFEYIRKAVLTYPYHCCAFQHPKTHDPVRYAAHEMFVARMRAECANHTTTASGAFYQLQHRYKRDWHPLNSSDLENDDTGNDGTPWYDPDQNFHAHDLSVMPFAAICGNLSKDYDEVECYPIPDAFNPCEDLMGNWLLRIPAWFVALAAIVGNIAVAVVLVSSRFRMTVPKLLMCNLSVADFCMGLYLLMITAMDAHSIGDYFNHAIDWQRGPGCQVAGFLTVFGNVLSIFTLAVITCERWYTITWAIHLNKRLKLSTAMHIMFVGWLYAITMAVLPLFGVSGYSRTSICLPLEHRKTVDALYLFVLLAFNALAFVLICVCYASMYRSVRWGGGTRGDHTCAAPATRSDLTVAKRMALLVFTDFACWAPIAFFGLTALCGYPLINVTQTKILLVFFYPLNSCANPYLYALLTQQYRRDLFILLGRYGLCKDRANRYKEAIGGVPIRQGSAKQFKRPNADSMDGANAGSTGTNRHRWRTTTGGDRSSKSDITLQDRKSSLLSTIATSCGARRNSLCVVPEMSLRALGQDYALDHICTTTNGQDSRIVLGPKAAKEESVPNACSEVL